MVVQDAAVRLSFPRSCHFVSVLLVIFLGTCCLDATFIAGPVSVNTTLNSTVTFTCVAFANAIFFKINGTPVGGSRDGFTESYLDHINSTVVKNLTAEAREEKNNTEISCFHTVNGSDNTSDTAILRIQGLLAGVGNLTANQLNRSTVLLTWTPPYTLDNVPITGYYIDTINSTVNDTNTIIPISDDTNSCTLTYISISAINGAGTGVPTSVSFYYQTVPQLVDTHNRTKLVPFVSEENIVIQISFDVSRLCTGQYPTTAVVNIKDFVNDNLLYNESLTFPVTDNIDESITINTTIAISVNNLKTFTVNVSLSNKGGMFPTLSPFVFGFLGPVVNINSSIDNCSTINVTWSQPNLDKGVTVSHYILKIYDAVNNILVNMLLINETSYQFEDEELFQHLYTYTVIPVNQLGEGESSSKKFSYQRAPRSAILNTSFNTRTYNQTAVNTRFNIPVVLICTGEAPENANVSIICGMQNVFDHVYHIPRNSSPMNITSPVTVARHTSCTLKVVFENDAGSSEPVTRNISTYDIRSATAMVINESSICVMCTFQLFSLYEGCHIVVTEVVTLNDTFTMETRNLTLTKSNITMNGNTTIAQGYLHDFTNGVYDVMFYDLENGSPVLSSPAVIVNGLNVTINNITHTSDSKKLPIVPIIAGSSVGGVVVLVVLISAIIIIVAAIKKQKKKNDTETNVSEEKEKVKYSSKKGEVTLATEKNH